LASDLRIFLAFIDVQCPYFFPRFIFMKFPKPLLIIIVLAVLLLGWVWSTYNNLIVAREGVDGAWAQVETQYQRRFDLIR